MKYRKLTPKHAESRLYGNIGTWFTNGDTFSSFLEQLEAEGFEQLTLRMHCYGGSVFEGNVMGNALSRSSMKINVVIDGLAASMGCFILSSLPREQVVIASNGFGMVHRPVSFAGGDADDHVGEAKLLRDMENNFIETVSQRTGKTKSEVKKMWFDGKDHWLNAEEMVSFGFASATVSPVAKSMQELDKDILENAGMEDIYARFEAALKDGSNMHKNNNLKQKKMNVALWISAFGLQGLTAESTEESVVAALQAKLKEQNDRIAALESEAKARDEQALESELDTAEAQRKFDGVPGRTAAQVRASYKEIGEKVGLEAMKTALAGIRSKSSIVSQISGGKGASAASEKNWSWYQENDPRALEKMVESDPETFRELYKAEFGNYPAE